MSHVSTREGRSQERLLRAIYHLLALDVTDVERALIASSADSIRLRSVMSMPVVMICAGALPAPGSTVFDHAIRRRVQLFHHVRQSNTAAASGTFRPLEVTPLRDLPPT